MEKNIDVSIIIVNYNTRDLTLACIESLRAQKTSGDRWELLVVDNASSDDSLKAFRALARGNNDFVGGIQVIGLPDNRGFAGGNNVAIARARGKYILLLNSDTEVKNNAIQSVAAFLDNHKAAGAAGCLLLLPDGSRDPACHRGFPTPWAAATYFLGLAKLFPRSPLFNRYHLGYLKEQTHHQIDSPSGAFFMVRKSVVSDVGLLDEDFFMYGEDIDWAYRMKKKHWEIWYVPEAVVLHHKKQSGRAHNDQAVRKQTQLYFFQTMRLFYQKHFVQKYPFVVNLMVDSVLGIRIFILKTFSL